MSLDKSIEHGKEKRKPYYKSGKFDRTCRCHGGCPYCLNNRMVQIRKEKERVYNQIQDLEG